MSVIIHFFHPLIHQGVIKVLCTNNIGSKYLQPARHICDGVFEIVSIKELPTSIYTPTNSLIIKHIFAISSNLTISNR